MADMLSHGTQSADYLRHERVSRSERLEGGTSEPLNPMVAWSIVLLGSFLLSGKRSRRWSRPCGSAPAWHGRTRRKRRVAADGKGERRSHS
jgi:hypothetical protein